MQSITCQICNKVYYKIKKHLCKDFMYRCPDCLEKYIKQYQNDPNYYRKYTLKAKYNLTENEYNIMAKKQNNLCYICKQPETIRGFLCVDHDHKTDKIRKLLCSTCNKCLGYIKDNPLILMELAKYLLSHTNATN